jgi:hypothetical protein
MIQFLLADTATALGAFGVAGLLALILVGTLLYLDRYNVK